MRTILYVIATVVLCIMLYGNAIAQKADGYAYQQNDNFPPGIYEAIVNAKVYFDIDKKAIEKGLTIKKGQKINVYSAGHHSAQPPSIDWFNLSDGQECNGKILPWDKLGWIGVLKNDFKRIENLPKPIYKNGVINNCAASTPQTSPSSSNILLLVIKAVPQTTPDKAIKKREPAEVSGIIEQGHDAAGGNFQINGGKSRQYTLRYVWDLDDSIQSQLANLAESRTKVTVKGTLKFWKDGSAAFDDAQPISIYK